MTTPTVGSLYSGIGGMDLGLETAGFQVAWQVENDPWCQLVLRKHWPDVPLHGDVNQLDLDALPPVDLVAAGFPCQPVSNAGRRKGTEDDRWLWPATLRVLRHLRPRWVLLENTPGLLTTNRGAAFNEVLAGLAELGYMGEWESLPAAAAGAPHLRYRIFIVAYTGSPRLEDGRVRRAAVARPAAVADTEGNSVGTGLREGEPAAVRVGRSCDRGGPHRMADSDSLRREGQPTQHRPAEALEVEGGHHADGRRPIFDLACLNPIGRQLKGTRPWAAEPAVGRVAHGIPRRVDRLRGLGNAVVPQVAEWIGRRILEQEEQHGS